ncbi:MAG: hypothetical protein HZB14_00440 [Actinobacteria bacterium]|nr:hypothetical protein [Actinomycetota bacterium]
MSRNANPYIDRPEKKRPARYEADQPTTEFVALALAWSSWAWATFFVVLSLFFVGIREGQTFYESDGAAAIAGAGLLFLMMTAAVIAMSVPRWRRAAGVMAAIAACAVFTAIFSLSLFLVPAAFGFAMAALFELSAARDRSG